MAAEKFRRVPAQPREKRRFIERSDLGQIINRRARRIHYGMTLRVAQVQDGKKSQPQSQLFKQINFVRNKRLGHPRVTLQYVADFAFGQTALRVSRLNHSAYINKSRSWCPCGAFRTHHTRPPSKTTGEQTLALIGFSAIS